MRRSRRSALMCAVCLAVVVLGSLAAASDARSIRGTKRADTLRGTNRADVIRGGKGNDRLYGRGGRDRLIGGPGKDRLVGGSGKDRLSCGGGRDTAIADSKDVVRACEVVKDKNGNVLPFGRKPVTPRSPSPAPAPAPSPGPGPVSDWTAVLTRGLARGAWFEIVAPNLDNLWFFHNLGAAGYRQGTRNSFNNHNYGTSPFPADFIWYVQGNVLFHQWVPTGFIWHQTQLVSYDPQADVLRVVFDNGQPGVLYGCRNGAFPPILIAPGTC